MRAIVTFCIPVLVLAACSDGSPDPDGHRTPDPDAAAPAADTGVDGAGGSDETPASDGAGVVDRSADNASTADRASDRTGDGASTADRMVDGATMPDRVSTDAITAPDRANNDAPASEGGSSTDAGATSCAGKPDATNTGVPAGTVLTIVSQDVTVTQDNTVIDAQDIHGFLTIKASHVKVLRSIVRGHATTATTAIIRIDAGTDILIEDTEVAAAEPSVDVDGISGANFIGRRLHVHGGVDGMKLGSNTSIECSYIHELISFPSDPNQNGGPTHNDAIQILSGVGIRLVGNQLVAAKNQNAAVQITQDFGMVGNLHLEKNWADGGGCTFNISHNGAASLTDVFTTGNRFGRNSSFSCPILKSTKTTLVSTGDVWDDDDMIVPIQTHD
ncbi:MAG TPA: hypothetical protein VK550_21810 [Polyangiaceae bacterium]|nr:hypothetical protein [Polyangiaceae bacterium]